MIRLRQTGHRPQSTSRATRGRRAIRQRKTAVACKHHGIRNAAAGWRIEVDPVLGPDGRVADLNLAPEHVEHRGNLQGHPMLSRYPQQPVFSAQKITTAVTAIVGHQCFIGTMSTPRDTGVNGRQDDGRTWLAFVKVTVE